MNNTNMSVNHMQRLSVVNNVSGVHYEDIKNVCRSCLSKDVALDLFYTIYEGNLLIEIYELVTLIQVERHDDLPSKLCKTCAEFLVRYYNFKQRALHSEIILQKVTNKKVKEEKLSDSANGVEDNSIVVEVVDESGESKANAEQEEISENHQSNAGQEEINQNRSDEEQEIANENPNFTCSFCGSNFETFAEYKVHRKRESAQRVRRYPCPVCQKFVFGHKLADHMCIHTKEYRFQCEICQKKFKYKNNLSRHAHLHNKEKPHTCDLCGKGFVQAPALKEHIRRHASEKTFMCEICGKLFVTSSMLTSHLLVHKVKDKKSNICKCPVCEKKLSSYAILKRHQRCHSEKHTHSEKQNLCNDCGKTYASKSALQTHFKVHTGEKPFVCQICNKRFAQSRDLQLHIRTHTGEKPVVCTICEKRFTQKSHLNTHMKRHTGERPFTYTYCNKSFIEKGYLRVHVRMHTGEKPYVCDICNKAFYDNRVMKKHRKTHYILGTKEVMQ